MNSDLVPDDLWTRIAAMLPPRPQRRHRYAGRHRTSDRIALAGIIHVLRTDVAWRDVPRQEVGCSGVTAWRRLRDWTEAGVWPRLHAAILTELRAADGNRHDVTQLMPLVDAIPRIRGPRGRPRHRPRRLFADRGYDIDKYRRLLRHRGTTPKIARRGAPHGSGLGRTRWVIERTFARLRADLHQGLLELACSIICLRRLRISF